MSVSIDGERISGQAVRAQNVMAAVAVANVLKSSLGPIGLDKMLVDDIGDVTVTNDGATILRLLEIEHPAAKVLADLAAIQDKEVGDGTTSVVLIAAELLKSANELCKIGHHPTTVIAGYRMACREACRYIHEKLALSTSKLSDGYLINVAETSMSSKIIGSESTFFARMVVEAATLVKSSSSVGGINVIKCDIDSVNVLKEHGGKMKDSLFVKGYALNCTIACEAMPKKVTGAKIALLDFSFQKMRMPLGIQVLVDDPNKIEAIRDKEINLVLDKIKLVLASGANVVLCSGGIDDMCMKPFVEANSMAVRRVKKSDLRKIADATGGTVCLSLSTMSGEEGFDSSCLGHADEVEQRLVSYNELIVITGSKSKRGASIILRGANDFLCDEMERSVHDALCAVKRVIESDSLVPGGGAVEAALSVHIEDFATGISTKEQMPIAKYADALLIIPKTLSINAALDCSDIVSNLRATYFKQSLHTNKNPQLKYGLDLYTGEVRDSVQAGVLEPTMSKIKMLKFATEAAITILRIDDLIKLAPERKERNEDDCCG